MNAIIMVNVSYNCVIIIKWLFLKKRKRITKKPYKAKFFFFSVIA